MYRFELLLMAAVVLMVVGYILHTVGYQVPFWLLGFIFVGLLGVSNDR